MAGTTIKDNGNVADAFISACRSFDVAVTEPAVKRVMGWRKIDAIHLLLDQFAAERAVQEPALAEQIHQQFTNNMVEFYNNDATLAPLPYAEELFRELKQAGVKIALNSGFTRVIVDTILERLDWHPGGLIDAVIASDEVPEGRPQPFMIHQLMQQTGVQDPSFVVKTGDTEVDIEEGRNAECGLVVGITTGAYKRQQLELYFPDKIIDSLNELASLIL